MSFKFKKSVIWQKAMALGEDVNTMSNKFPKKERYDLSSQIRRPVGSIALNIAEGSMGRSNPEFRKFLGCSIRSLAEVVTCPFKPHRRNHIAKEEPGTIYNDSHQLMNMMVAFKKKIQ